MFSFLIAHNTLQLFVYLKYYEYKDDHMMSFVYARGIEFQQNKVSILRKNTCIVTDHVNRTCYV